MNQHKLEGQLKAIGYAALWHQRGSEALWRVCFVAHAAIRYESADDPLTPMKLARLCNRDVDVVYRWAQAAVTWRGLWSYFRRVAPNADIRSRLRWLRHVLPYSHFATAGDLMRRLDLSPLEVFAMLDTAARSGAGVRSMAGNTAGEEGGGEGGSPLGGDDEALILAVWRGNDRRLAAMLANGSADVVRLVVLPAEWGPVERVKVVRNV